MKTMAIASAKKQPLKKKRKFNHVENHVEIKAQLDGHDGQADQSDKHDHAYHDDHVDHDHNDISG